MEFTKENEYLEKKKYPANRSRPKNYNKHKRLIDIRQLPENEYLPKSMDKEYQKRYSYHYNKIQRKLNNKTRVSHPRIRINTEGLKDVEDRNQIVICRKDNFVISFD
tara:strand:+ start:2528 stop:2848 length:321 start_codon:yes stop_codon:yes gene_type:complete